MILLGTTCVSSSRKTLKVTFTDSNTSMSWSNLFTALTYYARDNGQSMDRIASKPFYGRTFVDRMSYLHNWNINFFGLPGQPISHNLVMLRHEIAAVGVAKEPVKNTYCQTWLARQKKLKDAADKKADKTPKSSKA